MPDPVVPPSTTQTPPATPVQPAVQAGVAANVPPAGQGSSKSMVWVILAAFAVVAVLVGVGIYLYLQLKDSNPAFQQVSQNVQDSFSGAENDLNSVEPKEITDDFTDIDKELNNL